MADGRVFRRAVLGVALVGAGLCAFGTVQSGSAREGGAAAAGISCPTSPEAAKEGVMTTAQTIGGEVRPLPPVDAVRPARTETAVFALG